jgi:hypothetical protein
MIVYLARAACMLRTLQRGLLLQCFVRAHTHTQTLLQSHTLPCLSYLHRLQRYETLAPVSWVATPESSFEGLASLATSTPNVKVTGPGSLRLDYGREVRPHSHDHTLTHSNDSPPPPPTPPPTHTPTTHTHTHTHQPHTHTNHTHTHQSHTHTNHTHTHQPHTYTHTTHTHTHTHTHQPHTHTHTLTNTNTQTHTLCPTCSACGVV